MDSLKTILEKVQKPGRYIGCEVNSVRKKVTGDMLSVVLAYPDTYEVGMSYLGLRILYHLLNERDDVSCERVFMPWADMAAELELAGRRLFSLEAKRDINDFDIVGFSLSYELTYTNVLSMLRMGGVTVRAAARRDDEPLVIAGGACCYNPEPMSGFIDAFIIGDGEEVLPEFIDAYRRARASARGRKDILKAVAFVRGVYVPSLYRAEREGKRFLGLRPMEKGIPETVERATVGDLETAYYPVRQIVPLIKIVHDRMAVEVMRGCPNRCRFCQASAVNRPVRLRSAERVREICRETYAYTGYERIALLSLSSVNYPYLGELVSTLNGDFRDKGVGISIPSLRVDEAFYGLPEMISAMRKTGLTFALESASDAVREALGKDIDLNVLCKSAELAFRHGWRRLKLYFMLGFPGETEDEVERIVKVAGDLSRLKRTVSGGAAEINVSVNPFIPKAHTPLQWLGMAKKSTLASAKAKLISSSSKKVKFEMHDLEQSVLEACMSRGGREMSEVIYTAWKNGAGMDSWSEFFDPAAWRKAFSDNGMEMEACAGQKYDPEDILPWGHIKPAGGEGALKEEFRRSGFLREEA